MKWLWPKKTGPEMPDAGRHDLDCEAEYLGGGNWTQCDCSERSSEHG